MTQRIGGYRRKTRSKFKKNINDRGKVNIARYLQTFQLGDRVNLSSEPAVQNGMYHSRFHGKTGLIVNKKGSCYEVSIHDGKKEKILIIHPVHLRKCLT